MRKRIDPRSLTWVCAPQLYILSSDKIVVETEPHTDLKPAGGSAEAVELSVIPNGNFCFSARVEFEYRDAFDQCGLILYEDERRKMIIGTQYRDKENLQLHTIVFHGTEGDRSVRDIGSAIRKMHYRIWYRSRTVRVQYSFTGRRWSDFREFRLKENHGNLRLGIYACSPGNSYFDCTFSGLTLEEEEETS